MASGLFGRNSRGLLCRTCSSEDKKRGRGQGKERNQKTEGCGREEEKEIVGVCPITLGQSASRGHCFIREC